VHLIAFMFTDTLPHSVVFHEIRSLAMNYIHPLPPISMNLLTASLFLQPVIYSVPSERGAAFLEKLIFWNTSRNGSLLPRSVIC